MGSVRGPRLVKRGPASKNAEGHDLPEGVEPDEEAGGAAGRHDKSVPARKAVQPRTGLENVVGLLVVCLLGVVRSLVCLVGGSISLVFGLLSGIVGAFGGMVTSVCVIGALGCF